MITLNKIVRNYIKLIVLIIFIVIITLLICNIYKNYNENKVNKSYLSKYVGKADYLDITSILTEINDIQPKIKPTRAITFNLVLVAAC